MRGETPIYGARLSSTSIQPVVQGNIIKWAVADEEANQICFYTVDLSNLTKKPLTDIEGDINCDGAFNISDVVLLQEWLLAVPDTHLANWKAADFYEDDRLDVFDLCMMKRELIYG